VQLSRTADVGIMMAMAVVGWAVESKGGVEEMGMFANGVHRREGEHRVVFEMLN